MKKLICAILLTLTLLSLTSCKDKYPAQNSTDEEARVIYTLRLDGEVYEIRYELYRALFLSHKNSVDGGDESVWTGENKDEFIQKINGIILDRASDIFSALHVAKKLGYDPYSKDFDKRVKEYITLSVEGNEGDVVGFGGSYEEYLASLKDMNLNYAVQDLMIRYSYAIEKINEYYIGTTDEVLGLIPGEYEFSRDDVANYYFGEDCARFLHAYMQKNLTEDTYERMTGIRTQLLSAATPKDAAIVIINTTSVTPTDLIVNKEVSGIIAGRYTLNDNFYEEYKNALFSLEAGEVSPIIEINDGTRGYYIIYGLEKSEEHFNAFYDDIKLSYLDNLVSEKLYSTSSSLSDSAHAEEAYSDIVHSDISMD